MNINEIVMTRQEVRDFDRWAIEILKIPGVVLMENAGKNFTHIFLEKIKPSPGAKIVIICGTGNNGGDGFVIARHLANQGFDARIVIYGETEKISGDARINYEIVKNMNLPIGKVDLSRSDIIIDAILGTGFTGVLRQDLSELIDRINSLNKTIVAVDIPSGLDCDTGFVQNAAIKADLTITFAAYKRGFLNPDSRQFTGCVSVADIGISPKFKNNCK